MDAIIGYALLMLLLVAVVWGVTLIRRHNRTVSERPAAAPLPGDGTAR